MITFRMVGGNAWARGPPTVWRAVAVLGTASLAPTADAYLATFVFRATSDAKGDFDIVFRSGDGTVLVDGSGQPLDLQGRPAAEVSIGNE